MGFRGFWMAAVLVTAAGAEGQLAAPVVQCIDGYNNTLRLVSQQAGKSARACLRAAAKSDETDPDTCVVANSDGKIAGKEAKVQALYASGKCGGAEPIQRGAAIGTAAHRGAATDLIHDLFGDPVTAAVIGLDSGDARCLDTVLKRGVQAFAAIAKGHRQCKRDGLRSGAVLDAATLDAACGAFAQVDAGGKAQARLTHLVGDVGVACGTTTAGLATLFPGLDAPCHADGGALGGCVAERIRCRTCLALNEADGQHIDCDLFDDGVDDASCVAYALGARTCAFAPGSQLFIQNSALPLFLSISGAATVDCGATDAAQAAPCACDLTAVGPIVLPAIGDFCITPAPGCPSGGIDCDGGPARDVDLAADHNIGACASNAACAAACDAHCAGLGAAYGRQASGCEGYCQGGASDDLPCAQDSDCPGASCVGGNSVGHAGVCNCICETGGLGLPSGAGHLDCSLGLQVHIELPSDGDCLDASIETLPPRCVGITTATASGIDHDSDNNMSGLSLPYSGPSTISGTAPSCDAIEGGSLAGTRLVGHTVFFDSTLGDNFARLSLVCQ